MKNEGAEKAPILIDMDNNPFRTPSSVPCKICGGELKTHIKDGKIIGLCSNNNCQAKSSRSPKVLSKNNKNDINLYWMMAAYIHVVEKWNANNQ